jgi:hypothetical protein
VVQEEPHYFLVRILIEMVNPVGVEKRRAPLEAMHLVTLFQKEFSEIGAILSGDAGD